MLTSLLQERILIIDGAMGTMIQGYGLHEADFRDHPALADHPRDLKGNNELLSLTRPHLIEEIHAAFLDAGADIIETNTFNANRISQEDYGTQHLVRELNLASAAAARRAALAHATPDRPRLVAGAVGPTPRTLSLSPDVNDPAYRSVTFQQVRDAYREQIDALLDGGVDLLLIETAFDTLNMKAAIVASHRRPSTPRAARSPDASPPPSPTPAAAPSPARPSTPSGPPSCHARPACVGINCALGARDMRPYVEALSAHRHLPRLLLPQRRPPQRVRPATTSHPSHMAAHPGPVRPGGLAQRRRRLLRHSPRAHPRHRRRRRRAPTTTARAPQPLDRRFSGLESFVMRPEITFSMVGERTNVTGSARFARLIRSGDYDAAVEVAASRSRAAPTSSTSTWTRASSTPRTPCSHLPQPHRHRARHRPHPRHDRQLPL
jgi:5-methyltetrahydrofolate--homocysteine methyltransferase